MRNVVSTICLVVLIAVSTAFSDLYLWGSTEQIISVGEYRSFFYDESHAIITAPNMSSVNSYDRSFVTLLDGGYITSLTLHQEAALEMLGGTLSVALMDDSTAAISGGIVRNAYLYANSSMMATGGQINSLRAYYNSTVIFHGQNFVLSDGLTLTNGRITGAGLLKGEWLDGTRWATDILIQPSATVLVNPEPATLLLFGLGCMVLLRKR